MSDEPQNHADNLKAARSASFRNSVRNTRKNIKAAANVVSLMGYVEPFTDWLFGIPLIVVFTPIVSLAIGAIMLLTGSSGKRKTATGIAQGMTKKFKGITTRLMVLLGGSSVEAVPAVSLAPLESLIVVVIFWMTLVERKKNAQAQEQAQMHGQLAAA